MSLKNKLNRFKSHMKTDLVKENIKNVHTLTEIPFLDKWSEVGVTPYYHENEYCLIREKRFPLSYKHGHYHLGDFITAVDYWNDSNLKHPLSTKGYRADQLFFFDTETTGLGGGVGNSIFILGHASIKQNEVVLTQHILPHPGAEIPLYYSFLSQVDYETLVTYNGKSFDWPQVKTQHTLIREHVPKLPEFGHFDLFHAAKRMWKHRLERMKLSIVENEVLGVKRMDDTPGYLAPIIYFDYVERKDPEGMIKILKHNEIDILSLISLYTHLSYQIMGIDENQTSQEKFEVGKWFSSLGEMTSAKGLYKEIDDVGDPVFIHSQLQLGYLYKKQKEYLKSLDCFQKVLQSGTPVIQIEACVEAAKILEHQFKDYEEAAYICDRALKLSQTEHKHPKIEISEIMKRKDRIMRKHHFLGKRKILEDSSK
ncbi:ribonuclease H-like domain-containing protein [Neobacillus sp. D3-1R]|uniref:ribonuclease H-like domain-containing protein n=1 Tax=Neobacillus sp. D3-1R TaxID=3445778 RepID=UPI003F9F1F11